jgi:DNA polymerase-3 subunit beta
MLGTVLIKTVGGKLSLLCSDTAVLARTLTSCTVDREGEFCVDVKRLNDLVRAIPENQSLDMTLEDKGVLFVKSGRSRFRLPTLATADYPRMAPANEERITLNLSARRLAEMLEQVSEAMAVADVRHYLNGALVALQSGYLTIVGTDGFRMMVVREPIAGSEQIAARSLILPRKTVLLVRRLMAQGGDVKVALGSADAQFSFSDGTVLIARSVDGKYPDYERAIPQTTTTTTVNAQRFSEALGLIDATTESEGKLARGVKMSFDKETLKLTSGEQSRCEIDADCPSPNQQELSFNIELLRSSVATIAATGERMRVCYPETQNVICLRPIDADYPLSVVMGLRL